MCGTSARHMTEVRTCTPQDYLLICSSTAMQLSCFGTLLQRGSNLLGMHLQDEHKPSAPQATRLGCDDVVLARTHYPTGTPCPLATALRTAGAQITAWDQGLTLRHSLAQQRPGAASGASSANAAWPVSSQHLSRDGMASASEKSAAAMPIGAGDQTAADASHMSCGSSPHTDRASKVSSLSAANGSAGQASASSSPNGAAPESANKYSMRASVYGWRTPQQLARLLGQLQS